MSRGPSAARAWLLACRPKTLSAGAAPVMLGSALAWADGAFHALSAVLALVGALAIQIGTNLFNDYADFVKGADTEARLGPARAVQQGWLSPAAVRRGAAVAFGIAAAAGVYLALRGGWPIVALGLLSLGSGYAYTGGPFPLAYTGVADLFVLAFFGVGAVAGTYYVQAQALTLDAVLAGLGAGAVSTAVLVVNNLRDRQTDAVAGKRTLAVRFGAGFARGEYLVLLVGAYAVTGALALRGRPGALVSLITVPLALLVASRVLRRDGAALNPLLGATAGLLLAYCVSLSLGLILGLGVAL